MNYSNKSPYLLHTIPLTDKIRSTTIKEPAIATGIMTTLAFSDPCPLSVVVFFPNKKERKSTQT